MSSRLSGAASPYLRSHADQPVAWFRWSAEAFAEAQSRDVPVFISIGYSTCHWCHVMSRESFSDAQTAAVLNAGFVAIKVDREEHPEVDAAYLAQASAFTPYLGWPLSIFALPDGRAFHAATYLPPERHGDKPSFVDVLEAVTNTWQNNRAALTDTADAVATALAKATHRDNTERELSDDALAQAVHTIVEREDLDNGGFGFHGPKFPLATTLQFLLHDRTAALEPRGRAAAQRALAAMRASALFDPIDGGFFRYTTNPNWTVPHYERMLIDNAQLIDVALQADDLDTATRVAEFLRDVLLQPSGGFGAAQDAESIIDGEPSEGGYYTCSVSERALLVPPAVDGKVVTGWNGLAIRALANLALRTGNTEWRQLATDVATSVFNLNGASGTWLRSSLGDVASTSLATAADLAQFAMGLTRLAMAEGDARFATLARDIVDSLRDGTTPRLARVDPVLQALGTADVPDSGDGDEPSAAAALALAAIDLANLGAADDYRALAETIVAERFERAVAEPLAFGSTLAAAAALSHAPTQLVVIAADPVVPLVHIARTISTDVTTIVTPTQAAAFADAGFSLFEGRAQHAAYLCHDFVCALPITDADELAAQAG